MKVRVLTMTGAKDPDEYIKKFGADGFRNLLEKSEDHTDYTLGKMKDKYDLNVPESKLDFLKEAETYVAGFSGKAEREVYAMRIAEMIGVSSQAVRDDVENMRKRNSSRNKRQAEKQEISLAGKSPVKSIRYENSRSAMAEEGIIRLLYLDSQLFDRITPPDPSHFSVPELGNIYREMLLLGRTQQVEIPKLTGRLSGDELSLLTTIIQKPETVANGQKALSDYISIMESERRGRMGDMSLTELAESMRNKKAYNK